MNFLLSSASSKTNFMALLVLYGGLDRCIYWLTNVKGRGARDQLYAQEQDAMIDQPTDTFVRSGECHADILGYAGRPQLLTTQNNSDSPKVTVMEHIPPVQTSPCPPLPAHDFRAKWKETLTISANLESTEEKTPVLLFEVSNNG